MAKKKDITSPQFSLYDFIKKSSGKNINGIFDKSCLNEDGTVMSFIDQASIVTHYLQLMHLKFEKTYKKRGDALLKLWSKFLDVKDVESVCDADVAGEDTCSLLTNWLFADVVHAPFMPKDKTEFTFIDLFAGIGGFRIAMQECGGRCIYSSEWDENARKTYYKNFGEVPFGDITKEETKSYIPQKFDVLCAGFPCQAFSIAGYQKGFEDTRGTLFFDVAEIIKRHRPKAVFLENVKNLMGHDEGRTYQVIKSTLEELGYVVYTKVMNSMEYANVPQNRERIFIVCFDPKQVKNHESFAFPPKIKLTKTIADCIDYSISDSRLFYGEKFPHYEMLVHDMTSRDTIYQWRRQYVRENKSNVCPTLTANMGTGGHNVPLILTNDGIRKLSPKECLNFQGFPKKYIFPDTIAESAKYKQAGNSVVVPLIHKVCKNIISTVFPHS